MPERLQKRGKSIVAILEKWQHQLDRLIQELGASSDAPARLFLDLETSLDSDERVIRLLAGCRALEGAALLFEAPPVSLKALGQSLQQSLTEASEEMREALTAEWLVATAMEAEVRLGSGAAIDRMAVAWKLGARPDPIRTARTFMSVGEMETARIVLASMDAGPAQSLALARCHLLAGEIPEALRLAQGVQVAPEESHYDKVRYERAFLEGLLSSDLTQLMRLKSTNGLEDPVWSFRKFLLHRVGPRQAFAQRLLSVDYVTRRARENDLLTPECRRLRERCLALAAMDDTAISIVERIDRLEGEASSIWNGDLEDDLIFSVASHTAYRAIGQEALAERAMARYRRQGIRGPGPSDPLLLEALVATGRRETPVPTGSIGRSLGRVSFSALKSLVASPQFNKPQSMGKKLFQEAIGDVLRSEARKSHGLLRQILRLGPTIWHDIPETLRIDLRDALADGPTMPRSEVSQVLGRELGQTPERLFAEWHPEPHGIGSFSQVHRARLADGREVAVKVQHTEADQIVKAQVAGLKRIKLVFQSLYPQLDFNAFHKWQGRQAELELDLETERQLQGELAQADVAAPGLTIPRPVDEFCTPRVLVMEFARGEPLGRFCHTATSEERNLAAARILETVLRQHLRSSRYVFDLHAGNFLFHSEGVEWVDFGSSAPCLRNGSREFFDMFDVVEAADGDALQELLDRKGWTRKSGSLDRLAYLEVMRNIRWRPFLADEDFHFTHEYAAESFRAAKNFPSLRIDPEGVPNLRFRWSLLSTLADLGARINSFRIAAPLLDEYRQTVRAADIRHAG